MFVCPDCGQPVRGLTGYATIDSCPFCGTILPRSSTAWVDVARVSNLAEAGFLSDELAGMDIEASVFQSDDFSHADGGWKTSYLIRVPAELAQQAAAQIRGHIAEAAAESDAAGEHFGYPTAAGPVDPAYWRPVAVIVLAGVASFVLGRQSAIPEVERRPARDPLAAAVNSIGRPLVTESIPGEPQHRLWYHLPSRTWRLETDQNGDGIFEQRRQFHTSAAAVR